jgi:hypothetical protein
VSDKDDNKEIYVDQEIVNYKLVKQQEEKEEEEKFDILSKLPNDIKLKIFKDHFEVPLLYDKVNELINSNDCRSLKYIKLSSLLKYVLSKTSYLEYFQKENSLFSYLYNESIVKNKKFFVKLDKIDR